MLCAETAWRMGERCEGMKAKEELLENMDGNSGEKEVEDGASTSSSAPQVAVTIPDPETTAAVAPLQGHPSLTLLNTPREGTELSSSIRINVPPALITTKSGKLSTRGLLPRPGLRSRGAPEKNGQVPTIPSGARGLEIVPSTLGSLSTPWNIIPLSAKRTTSLPVTSFSDGSIGSPAPSPTRQVAGSASPDQSGLGVRNIARSASMPLNKPASLRRQGSGNGATVLVKPATPRAACSSSVDDSTSTKEESLATQSDPEKGEKEPDEEIPEEEAVCRICMEDLTGEYGETFKMECSCRGELALAHKECALKWFSIKGNRTCDVCGQEVSNLPVTVVRKANESGRTVSQALNQTSRVWQDVPVLVMISMLAYFCFLEQLLVGQMGSGALAVALPFACVLGLIAAITASNLGMLYSGLYSIVAKRFIWIYAACQFGLVISFAHIFYDLVHVEAVLSILLAAFAGFGITVSANALTIEYVNWKRRAAAQAQRQAAITIQEEAAQPDVSEQGHAVSQSPPEGGGSTDPPGDEECLSVDPQAQVSNDRLLASPLRSHGVVGSPL